MRRYRGFVYSLCRSCLRDAHLAEDATQLTFHRLSRRARKLRFTCLDRYLKRTAKSISRDMARDRAKRSIEISLEQLCDERPDVVRRALTHPNIGIAEERTRATVLWALDRLDNCDRREAVALRILEDCSVQGIADVQNITRESAQKRVNRGVQELQRILRAEGYCCSFAMLALVFYRLRIPVPPGVHIKMPASGTAPPGSFVSVSRLLSPPKLFSALAAIIALTSALVVALLPRAQRIQAQSMQQTQAVQPVQAVSSQQATLSAASPEIIAPPAVVETLTFDQQLQRKLVGMTSERESLQDSLSLISTVSGVEIDADWDSIAAAGVDLKYAPGWNCSGISVLGALDVVFAKLCPGKLEYVVGDRRIVVRPRAGQVSSVVPNGN